MDVEATNSGSVPPTCAGCLARDRIIAQLQAQVAALEARLTKLEAAARGAKRQAAPFSKGSPSADPKKPGRKAGEEYGTHHRRPEPPRIDQVHQAPLPAACPFCSGQLVQTEVVQQYQTEIPRKVIYRQFDVAVGQCTCCHERVQGRHPLQTSDATGAAASQLGPDAQALVVQLNKEAGLSYGKISRFFSAAFDLDLARSAACRIILRAGKKCQPTYQRIIEQVQNSPAIVPDETGWRVGGQLAWLHVAVGKTATAYLIHPNRGYDASVILIGENYDGFMTHDAWSPYMNFVLATHQTCLAHLLRRCKELQESAVGAEAKFLVRVKEILKQSLSVRDQRDAGQITAGEARRQAEELGKRMQKVVATTRSDPDTERFAKHLDRQQTSLFSFLEFEGIDATNYKAEQAIRPATVNRKVWGGNRTDEGAKAQSVLMSVFQTAKQCGIEALDFVSQSLKAVAGKLPSLLPDTC